MKILPPVLGVAIACIAALHAWTGQTGITQSRNTPGTPAPASGQRVAGQLHPEYFGMYDPIRKHQAVADNNHGIIDQRSLTCLSCHDGVHGVEIRIRTNQEWETSLGLNDCVHPVGINYDRASLGNRKLRPASFLAEEIALPEGKVGCESCHCMHSARPKLLALNNSRSSLCLECHVI